MLVAPFLKRWSYTRVLEQASLLSLALLLLWTEPLR